MLLKEELPVESSSPSHRIRIETDVGNERLITPEEFHKVLGVEYLPHMRAHSEGTLRYARRCFRRGLARGFFHAGRRWLGRFYRREIERGLVSDVTIKWVDDKVGYGLFAARDFGLWEYVGIYTGKLRRRGIFRLKSNDYCFSYPTGTWSARPLIIDAQKMGNEMRFMNHGEEPNVEAMGVPVNGMVQLLFRACCPIAKGQQLIYDYGPYFWDHSEASQIPLQA